MKGGIKVLCYGVPIMLAVFGWFGKMELNRIHDAVERRAVMVSTGSAVTVEWDEIKGEMVPVSTVKSKPAEKLREIPAPSE